MAKTRASTPNRRTPMPDKPYLMIKEAARLIGVSGDTLMKYANGKNGPPIKRFSHNVVRFPTKPFYRWAQLDAE